jgi:hypothetical protein
MYCKGDSSISEFHHCRHVLVATAKLKSPEDEKKRLVSKLAAANSKGVKVSGKVESMVEKENVRASKIGGHGRKTLGSEQYGTRGVEFISQKAPKAVFNLNLSLA